MLGQDLEVAAELLDRVPAMVAIIDGDGCIRLWNRGAEELTGASAQRIVGRTLAQVFPRPVRPLAADVLTAALAGRSWEGEVETPRPSGTSAPVFYRCSPLRGPEGAVVGLIATGIDLTERRRSEAAERDYRAAIETALDGFAIVDRGGRVLDANEAFTRMLGFDRDELRAVSVFDLEVHDRPSEVNRQASIERNRARLETRYRRKDGRVIDVEISLSNGDPAAGRFFMFLRDVTEHRRLEEQFRQAQKMEAVGRLAGGVAHDFNNLLTAIAGYSELVLRSLPDGDDRRLDVEEIKRAGERATALTRQLLAFSRKQVLRPKVIDLNSVVVDLEKMLRRLIGEDIKMATQLGAAIARVKADPGQIEQVLMNLAVNARDAMPDGGTLRIATAEELVGAENLHEHNGARPGRHVVLEVTDTGVGMDEATSSHLFEPFFTTKEKGKGTGLGLATVYGVVSQSGGHIRVDTAPGRGTTFRIYLPAAGVDEPREASKVAAASPSPRGHETLLLVEDETNVREFAARVLREHGYNVIEATDGADAIGIARRAPSPVQLLITDVVMPRMNGRALVAELRRDQPHLEVLYISGYTPDDIADRGIEETEATMLPKPFSPEALVRKVRELLDARAARERAEAARPEPVEAP